MKKFLLLLVALFATTAMVKAEDAIAYPENPYGWQSKEDMYNAFMTEVGATEGWKTIAGFQAMAGTSDSADGLHLNGLCKYLPNGIHGKIVEVINSEKWAWLKSYIEANRAAAGMTATNDNGAVLKYEAGAFFISGQSTSWPASSDYSEAGKEENYLPKFVASYETPFSLVGTFNEWAIETAPDMTWQLDGSYKIKLGYFYGEFKIVQGHAWDGAIEYCSNGAQVNLGEEYFLANVGGNLSLSGSGYCEDCVITVRKDGESVVMTVTGTPVDEPYIIVGDYNDWKLETAAQFRVQQDGTFKSDALEELKGSFKVVKGRLNWNSQFGSNGSTFDMGNAYTLVAGSANDKLPNISLSNTNVLYKDVVFVLDMSGDAPTLTGTAGSTVELVATYQLMGESTSWSFADAPTFTKVSEGVYELQRDTFYGIFKITKNGVWDGSICTNGNAVVVGETYLPNNNNGSDMWIDGIDADNPLTNVKFTLNVTKADAPTLLVTGTTGAEKVAKDAVKVAVNGGVISVAGAENVAIYNAAGALVSTSAQANVPAGLYIVKAGKNVQKVIVK